MRDSLGLELEVGNVFDIYQTVNGQNLFYVAGLGPLDIRYNLDRSRIYEYNKYDLISPCRFTGESEFTIIERRKYGNKNRN